MSEREPEEKLPAWRTDPKQLGEAEALASAYAGGRSVRALISDTGHSFGYIHRRVSSLTTMRPKGNPDFGNVRRGKRAQE